MAPTSIKDGSPERLASTGAPPATTWGDNRIGGGVPCSDHRAITQGTQ